MITYFSSRHCYRLSLFVRLLWNSPTCVWVCVFVFECSFVRSHSNTWAVFNVCASTQQKASCSIPSLLFDLGQANQSVTQISISSVVIVFVRHSINLLIICAKDSFCVNYTNNHLKWFFQTKSKKVPDNFQGFSKIIVSIAKIVPEN